MFRDRIIEEIEISLVYESCIDTAVVQKRHTIHVMEY